MKTLIFILLTISAFFSHAAQNRALQVEHVFYSAKCDQRCQAGVTLDLYKNKDLSKLPAQIHRNLQKAAFEQAQIWGDTILEGDYAADGKVQIDAVLIIKQNSKILGYAITYSERAWYIGQCNYVHRNPDTLTSCEEGRIQERSFVSDNLIEVTVDQNQFAEFKPKD